MLLSRVVVPCGGCRQRHATIDEALAGQDSTIKNKLDWVETFTAATAKTLDVVSWHTCKPLYLSTRAWFLQDPDAKLWPCGDPSRATMHADDYHTSDIGMSDHTTLSIQPETPRLWSTKYLDLALRLSGESPRPRCADHHRHSIEVPGHE